MEQELVHLPAQLTDYQQLQPIMHELMPLTVHGTSYGNEITFKTNFFAK